MTMNRREFLIGSGLLPAGIAAAEPNLKLAWKRDERSGLFADVVCDGEPLAAAVPGLLDGFCRLVRDASGKGVTLNARRPAADYGRLRIVIRHELLASGAGGGEDLLEAKLTVQNLSRDPALVELGFTTSAQPSAGISGQRAYLPLNAAGVSRDQRFAGLGVKDFLADCDQSLGAGELVCHYLEPLASYPGKPDTRALLIAPVVDCFAPNTAGRVAIFTPSGQPVRFSTAAERRGWTAGRVRSVPPGGTCTERCWLMLHAGSAAVAWKAFHRFAHAENLPEIGWIRDFKVHYYDFLSSAEGQNGHRGDGYGAAVPCFRDFRVGMATQHGYYPCMGDCIHPDRKTWLAMKSDKRGPAEMSLARIKERIRATRAAGAKAAIYMHLTALDDSSGFYPKLASARLMGPDGQPVKFGWNGPDVKGGLWWMSIAAPEWRWHQLQQARWIMEILQPDAIVMDETFSGLGYDEAPGRRGPLGPHAVEFFRQMRSLVRSFGRDKAFFTSDCSMAGFVMWADGEAGDHTYPGLSGHPLYTQTPVRFLAALGDKPWRPCAWLFRSLWETQMKLARLAGAGVGLSDGWLEYTGLNRLPAEVKAHMIGDIASILGSAGSGTGFEK